MYGRVCLHATVQAVLGVEDKIVYIAACQQIIPHLYAKPSSWRWTLSFETRRRQRKN